MAVESLTLRKRLLATGSSGEKRLSLRNGLATESDTLLRVEDGTLPDEGLDASGTAIDLVESDLVNDLGTVLPVKRINVSIAVSLQGQQSFNATWPATSVEARDLLSEGLDLLNLLREELGESLLESLENKSIPLRRSVRISGAPLPES